MLEQGVDLQLSWEAPESLVLNGIDQGNHPGLVGLRELVRRALTIPDLSYREVVGRDVVHFTSTVFSMKTKQSISSWG